MATYIFVFVLINVACNASNEAFREKFFRKVKDNGEALAPEVIISSHVVHNEIQCSIKCLEQKQCVGFNYLVAAVKELEINCQISNSTQHNNGLVSKGAWFFYKTCQDGPISFRFCVANPAGDHVAVQQEGKKDIECFGPVGGCTWYSTLEQCSSSLSKANDVGVACGEDHKSRYGNTGYESDGHWCKLAKEKYRPKQLIVKILNVIKARLI